MLRINFTSEDLVRTRVASTWGPLGETFFSLMTLQQPGCRALFGGWRQSVHAESDACRHPASALFREAFLDLFTVTGASASIEEGLEALRAARPDYLDAELVGAVQARAHYSRCTGPWAGTAWGDIAHDRADRKELLAYLQDSHRAAVAPYWPRILSRLRAEQASHARTLAEHGVEAMLAGLPPGFRWQSPTLEIGRGALTGTVELAWPRPAAGSLRLLSNQAHHVHQPGRRPGTRRVVYPSHTEHLRRRHLADHTGNRVGEGLVGTPRTHARTHSGGHQRGILHHWAAGRANLRIPAHRERAGHRASPSWPHRHHPPRQRRPSHTHSTRQRIARGELLVRPTPRPPRVGAHVAPFLYTRIS